MLARHGLADHADVSVHAGAVYVHRNGHRRLEGGLRRVVLDACFLQCSAYRNEVGWFTDNFEGISVVGDLLGTCIEDGHQYVVLALPGLLQRDKSLASEQVRHRAGVWQGEAVASEHGVTFTVFMVCGPSYDRCHLLRLSRLDEPLD